VTEIICYVIGPWHCISLHMTTQQKQQGHKFLAGVETEHIRAAFEWQRVHVVPNLNQSVNTYFPKPNVPDFLHRVFSSTYFVRSKNKKTSVLLYTAVVKFWSADS
jgi:hypothetical protein